jgi:hypothetical protein
MSAKSDLQPLTIIDRMDETIGRIITDELKPAAIYLTKSDYDQFAQEHTRVYRAVTGSTALLYPLSHDGVPLINEKLVDRVEVPVRQRTGCSVLKSTIYASNGRGYPLDLP